MDNAEIEAIAYLMTSAYMRTRTMYIACDKVKKQAPDVENDIIRGMWMAIDAYLDINTDGDSLWLHKGPVRR